MIFPLSNKFMYLTFDDVIPRSMCMMMGKTLKRLLMTIV